MRHYPEGQLQASYDEAGDVCTSTSDRSPGRPPAATLTGEDVIVRDDGEEVVGVAMLHASRR